MHSTDALVVAVALAATAPLRAQAPGQVPPGGLVVGHVAPDFTLPGSTRDGPLATPVRLSNLKGQVVVLAFFPKARTSG